MNSNYPDGTIANNMQAISSEPIYPSAYKSLLDEFKENIDQAHKEFE